MEPNKDTGGTGQAATTPPDAEQAEKTPTNGEVDDQAALREALAEANAAFLETDEPDSERSGLFV